MTRFIKSLFLLTAAAAAFGGCATAVSPSADRVCFDRGCVQVAIADNKEEWVRGLQFRDHLPRRHGMLFIFPQSNPYSFWMKDTLIPLDMIWMDNERRIVHIESNVPPCRREPCPTYQPGRDAAYVLEISAGESAALGLAPGRRAVFHLTGH